MTGNVSSLNSNFVGDQTVAEVLCIGQTKVLRRSDGAGHFVALFHMLFHIELDLIQRHVTGTLDHDLGRHASVRGGATHQVSSALPAERRQKRCADNPYERAWCSRSALNLADTVEARVKRVLLFLR